MKYTSPARALADTRALALLALQRRGPSSARALEQGDDDMPGFKRDKAPGFNACICILFILPLIFTSIEAECSPAPSPKKILILNSYHKGFELTGNQVVAAS